MLFQACTVLSMVPWRAGSCGSPDLRSGHCLQLLPSQQAMLESVLHSIRRGWMCILVGGAGAGKTSLARTAAQLAGRKLTEIALTGGTDTADLLGGFEQLEAKRKVQVSFPPQCLLCAELVIPQGAFNRNFAMSQSVPSLQGTSMHQLCQADEFFSLQHESLAYTAQLADM